MTASAAVRQESSASRLMTLAELADYLQVSRSSVERAVAAGMPALDLGRHHPKRRPKRCLRFDLASVLAWYRERP
jgi:excisionase family DNA binding protein